MEKIDFRRTLRQLYGPGRKFELIDVPKLDFVMVDGSGDPNTSKDYATAVSWLYSVSYAMKFAAKAELAMDYVVPPLEGLWWANDPEDFVTRNKHNWHWTMMIMAPDFLTPAIFASATEKAKAKLGTPPKNLRLESFAEGPSLQVLHVGSYDDEGPLLHQLHSVEIPERGMTFNGQHHEIYISDPRRTAPERLKTILRQPVRPI